MASNNSLPSWVWKRADSFCACGFGSGAAPVAPGTFGTLAGLPFYWLLQDSALALYLGATLVLFVFGVWICGRTASLLGVHDHPGIVWDEIVGFLVAMSLAPPGWIWWLLGFLLFRLFDIWKPWPIRYMDRHVTGGFGIMFDDVLAGIYAALCMQLLMFSNLLNVN